MELKPGYKQTEAGIIPEDWEMISLGDIFTFKNGLNKGKEYFGYGTPIVNYMDVYKSSTISAQDLRGRVLVNPQEIKNYEVRKGDMFFTRTSETVEEIGMAAVVLDDTTNTVFSGFVLRARPKKNRLDNAFKAYCFSSEQVRRAIQLKSSYTTRALTNGRLLSSVVILCPPLPEQRAIAAALSDTDALLRSLDRLLAKKRDIKQAVMQQILTGKQRLPGFSGEWEMKRLGDFGKCLRGVSYKGDTDLSSHDTDTTIRLLRSNNVQEATINIKDVQYVNRERVSEQQKMQVSDVLICMANGSKELVGKAGIFKINDGHTYTFGAFMGCYRTLLQLADPAFLFFLFQTNQYRDYINNLLAGSIINNLKPSSIESLEFHVPLLPEQTTIASVLSDMDAEINALQQRRDKTHAIKQGMMQELLTGRTRLV